VVEWEYIRELQGQGIPIIHCLLRRHDLKYNFLVMEQLDHEDLEDKFQKLNRSFSMKTLLMLADQMIENIEIIHDKGVLHNDLKPDNMSMGMDAKNSSQLYIIDFGMYESWQEENGDHIKYQGFYSLIFY
jgi:serine/threonine protein kinase